MQIKQNGGRVLEFKRTPDRIIDQGDKLMQNGKYLEALKKYKEAELIDPNDYAVNMSLAQCYTAMSLAQKALPHVFRLAAHCKEFPPELFGVMGVIELERAHYRSAYIWLDMYFDEIDSPSPGFEDIYSFLSEKLGVSSKTNQRLSLVEDELPDVLFDDAFKDSLNIDHGGSSRKPPLSMSFIAKALTDDSPEDNGEDHGEDTKKEAITESLSNNLMLGIVVSQRLLEQGHSEAAVNLLSVLADKYPKQDKVIELLAYAWFCQEKFDQAIDTCKLLVIRRPNDIRIRSNLMIFLHSAGRFDEVREQLAYFKQKKSFELQDMEKLVLALLQVNEAEYALELQQRIEKWMPYNSDVLHRTAMCYLLLNDVKSARSRYEELLKIDEHDSIARYYYNKLITNDSSESADDAFRVEVLYTLPIDEVLRRLNTLSEFVALDSCEAIKKWSCEDNSDMRDVVCWALREMDSKLCTEVIDKLVDIAFTYDDLTAIHAVEEYLSLVHTSESMQTYAVGVVQPYLKNNAIIYCGRNGIYAYVTHDTHFESEDPDLFVNMLEWEWSERFTTLDAHVSFRRMYRMLIFNCLQWRDDDFVDDIADAYEAYVRSLPKDSKVSSRSYDTFVIAFELKFCNDIGLDTSTEIEKISSHYGITERRIANAIKRHDLQR